MSDTPTVSPAQPTAADLSAVKNGQLSAAMDALAQAQAMILALQRTEAELRKQNAELMNAAAAGKASAASASDGAMPG
jgi:hypothetical protein